MSYPPARRRLFLGSGVLVCGLLTVAVVTRLDLAATAVGFALRRAGATAVVTNVTEFSPWRVVLEDVGFVLKDQPFAAKRVSVDRSHWWWPSLGSVRVEQAYVPLTAGTRPQLAAAPQAGDAPALPRLPLEELLLDGEIVLRASGHSDQALAVKLAARQTGGADWSAWAQAHGPGMDAVAHGTYDAGTQQLDFSVTTLAIDVKAGRDFVDHISPLPALDGWELSGRVTGEAAGKWAAGNLAATGRLQLRQGRVNHAANGITAEDVEADLEFDDFAKLQTKSGTLRVRELRVKELPLRDASADFTLHGINRIDVSRLTLTALGGTVATEPFTYLPGGASLSAVLLVDGISIEEVMALTKDLPAKARGRVNGRFPINLDGDGFHLGTGWLALKPGVNAEVAFSASGLLTAGTSPNSPSYPVLQRIESGLLTLGISELRLDIQPPDAPPDRSATLHLAGAPVDPTVKAPVVLDLNVNGPLEKLLTLGLNSRLSVGDKP